MSRSLVKVSQEFHDYFQLTSQPVNYRLDLRLAHCSSRLYREQAARAKAGQPLSLAYSAKASQIILLAKKKPLGRLYAADAAPLLLLFAFYQRCPDQIAELMDQELSRVSFVQTRAELPTDQGRRFPKLGIHFLLALPQAWPLFVILAVLYLKEQSDQIKDIMAQNPWLAPLGLLQEDYRRRGHDSFVLPGLISSSWLWLTDQSGRTHEYI